MEEVATCPACQNQTWVLVYDGKIECSKCNFRSKFEGIKEIVLDINKLLEQENHAEEERSVEETKNKIEEKQVEIKCACVFWEPWECSKIRHLPDTDYEACTCICHDASEEDK